MLARAAMTLRTPQAFEQIGIEQIATAAGFRGTYHRDVFTYQELISHFGESPPGAAGGAAHGQRARRDSPAVGDRSCDDDQTRADDACGWRAHTRTAPLDATLTERQHPVGRHTSATQRAFPSLRHQIEDTVSRSLDG
jgi:hypothetical protein